MSYSLLNDTKMSRLKMAFIASLYTEGHVFECGVFSGGSLKELIEIYKFNTKQNLKDFYAFDTFEGLPYDGGVHLPKGRFSCSLDTVVKNVGFHTHIDLTPVSVKYIKGLLPETLVSVPLCFAHIDLDLGDSTFNTLRVVGDLIRPGGAIVVDDYNFSHTPMIKPAVDEWFRLYGKNFEIVDDRFNQWIGRKK